MRRLLPLLTSAALASTGCAHTTQPAAVPVTTTAADVPSAQADISAKATATSTASAPSGATPAGATPAGATPAGAAPSREDKANEEKATKDEGMGRDFGWISIGIGASAAAVALGTSYVMLHYNSVRSSNCNDAKVCSQAGADANFEIRDMAATNVAAWAIAAVGLGVGAFLVLTHPKKDGAGTAIGVSPNGSGGGVTLRSVF